MLKEGKQVSLQQPKKTNTEKKLLKPKEEAGLCTLTVTSSESKSQSKQSPQLSEFKRHPGQAGQR
jgi:hypothetical protein